MDTPPLKLTASSFWPANRTNKKRSSGSYTGSMSSVSDASDAVDSVSVSDGQLTPTLPFLSSRGDDQYVHVSGWFDVYDCSPCSKTETIFLNYQPLNELSFKAFDITTGHAILSYMEEISRDPERVNREWQALQQLDLDPVATAVTTITAASSEKNKRKNRSTKCLPYDSNRVKLQASVNVSMSDYINASKIVNVEPASPAYIIAQGPLPHTVADFWQMVWENGSTAIVNLSPEINEEGNVVYHRYWPDEGTELYYTFEVCLVSEHVWCADYVVRSLYVKNVRTHESRTITLFHFLTWPDQSPPTSVYALLDMRRKVNKCYRRTYHPTIVQCSDGGSRSGTYCLIDMVLNRIIAGAREVDIAATAEHIKEQRAETVSNKENFEFAFLAIATELFDLLSN